MLSPGAGAADWVIDKVRACILLGHHNPNTTTKGQGKEREKGDSDPGSNLFPKKTLHNSAVGVCRNKVLRKRKGET